MQTFTKSRARDTVGLLRGSSARAVIPATGRVGRHLIRLEDSPFGQPCLALDTSPWDFLEVPSHVHAHRRRAGPASARDGAGPARDAGQRTRRRRRPAAAAIKILPIAFPLDGRHALLSWQDHPSGFHFRFAFEVVEEEATEAAADR